jgi:hypothetical protein
MGRMDLILEADDSYLVLMENGKLRIVNKEVREVFTIPHKELKLDSSTLNYIECKRKTEPKWAEKFDTHRLKSDLTLIEKKMKELSIYDTKN